MKIQELAVPVDLKTENGHLPKTVNGKMVVTCGKPGISAMLLLNYHKGT